MLDAMQDFTLATAFNQQQCERPSCAYPTVTFACEFGASSCKKSLG